jgi:fido (protein-threonine AMPylation protein)
MFSTRKLSLQSCSLALPEKLLASFYRGQCQFGNLQQFTARYLAGGFCLKQGRTVPRKRLALMHIGLSRSDELAVSVTTQSKQYQSAVDALSQRPLTIDILCEVHKSLDPHHFNGGRFRDVQNWIGGGSPDKVTIVPRPPEKLLGLMNDWIDYVNGNEVASIEDIIVVANQFILIHPFNDGNGRLNRAIVDVLLSQNMLNKQA